MTTHVMTPDVATVLAENHRRFLGFLSRRVASREVAEDLLQDAFVRGLTKAPRLENAESVVAWFYRVLRNALVDHYRRVGAEDRALVRYAAAIARVDLDGASLGDFAREVGITPNNARAKERTERQRACGA